MNRKDFAVEFNKLLISKNKPSSPFIIETYWEDLRDLPNVRATLKEARKIKFYQDFNKTITKMPEVSDLIDLSASLSKYQRVTLESEWVNRDALKLMPPTPEASEEKQKEVKRKLVFYNDCLTNLDFHWEDLDKSINSNSIKIPDDYLESRKTHKRLQDFLMNILENVSENFRVKNRPPKVTGFANFSVV